MENIQIILFYGPLLITLLWSITIGISVKEKSNRFKLPFLLFLCDSFISIFIGILFHLHNFTLYAHLYPLGAFVALSMFPLFYLSIYKLTQPIASKKKQSFKHLIFPIISFIATTIVLYVFGDATMRINFVETVLFKGIHDKQSSDILFYMDKFLRLSFICSAIYYYILTERQVKRHRVNIIHTFSNEDEVNLGWFKYFRIILSLSLIAGLLYYVLDHNQYINNQGILSLTWILLTLFFWIVAYNFSHQKQIYTSYVSPIIDPDYVPNKIMADLKIRLNDLMNKEHLYRNSSLTIGELASKLGTNRTYTSQLLNTHLETNFNLYINTRRIEYAKELLLNENFKINDICYECGFSASSSFYRVFSEHVGITPSAYRHRLCCKK